MFDQYNSLINKDICPICKSNYNSFKGPREEWHNKDCNCFIQNKLWIDYSIAEIPNNFFSKDINDYEFTEQSSSSNFLSEIKKYIKLIDKVHQTGSCLFLCNELSAIGKTFFSICILKEAYRKKYSIKFLPFVKIYNEIINHKNDTFLKSINDIDFLVIDSIDKEVGREFLSDIKVLNIFEEFLKIRFKPIIFTACSRLEDRQLETIKITKSCLKHRIYELYIDSQNQYTNMNYWDNITSFKKEVIK
jgi:DNA replication protein DnaC